MHLFRFPDYESEAMATLRELKAKRPQLDQEQLTGRALLWDKDLNREALEEAQLARVPQSPYVYQTQPGAH